MAILMLMLIICAGYLDFAFSQAVVETQLNVQWNALFTLQAAWNRTPDPQTNLNGWSDKITAIQSNQTDPCPFDDVNIANHRPWRGVQCLRLLSDNSTKLNPRNITRIIGLTLRDASLTGSLPATIGDLSPLVTLALTGNPNLTGPIPVELFKLSDSLSTLELSDNGLTQTIPPELTRLSILHRIDLSSNQFTGQFPNFTNMVSLQTLLLAHNHLGGNLSPYDFSRLNQLVTLDLSDNEFTGPLPDLSTNPTLHTLNLSWNQFTAHSSELSATLLNGTISKSVRVIDLSSNRLSGPFPSLVDPLHGSLEELYLDNNSFSGTLDIASIIHSYEISATQFANNLKTISVIGNNISNVIYSPSTIFTTSIRFFLQGNPYCNTGTQDDGTRCYCNQICIPLQEQSNLSTKNVIAIALATSAALIILVVLLALYLHRKSYNRQRYLLLQVQEKCEEYDVKPTIYTYRELQTATRNFDQDMKLGEGGYGAVYKGILPNKNVVAVKRLYTGKSKQGMDDFLNEMVLISGMKHRNLVKLRGCCLREKERLLVYEYVDNHDLDWVLLERKGDIVSWPKRISICLGVAHGLHYLHALATPRIIHRDIKASNILLDSSLDPKIADFGLALLFPEEQSHIMTVHVAGTKGYLAPEYASMGQLSEKVDVYSFGVLILEIIAGRKNIDNKLPPDQIFLPNWAKRLHREGRLTDLIDPEIHLNDEETSEAQRVIYTALLCLQNSEELRPTMARVVSMLQGDLGTESFNFDDIFASEYASSRSSSSSSRSTTLSYPLESFTVTTNLTTVPEDSNEVPLIKASTSHHVVDMKRITAGSKSSTSNLSSGVVSDVDLHHKAVIAR
ncbi:hypothetical protein M758_7G016400 [Ceratodon purpureus]|nr:hypothetical protein M758_7G016400 [Ceratodon purpureus]